MRIDRCLCFGRTFEDLLECARSRGIDDVDDLRNSEGFGLKCGLCVPYMRRTLATGEVVFDRVIVDEPVAQDR